MTEQQTEQKPDDSAASNSTPLLVVYAVLFCDCIYESSFATISLHRTKEGAAIAMRNLKKEVFYGDGWFDEFCGFRYGKKFIYN